MSATGNPAAEPREIRLKRLYMRASHRGTKEMDLICTAWCEARLKQADGATLDLFEAFLEENDNDLYRWVSGQTAPPQRYAALVADMEKVMTGRRRATT